MMHVHGLIAWEYVHNNMHDACARLDCLGVCAATWYVIVAVSGVSVHFFAGFFFIHETGAAVWHCSVYDCRSSCDPLASVVCLLQEYVVLSLHLVNC